MTKRNAKRQLSAIYANSGKRYFHQQGGIGSPPPSCLSQLKSLSDKEKASVNEAIKKFKTALGKYSPLALVHFIKTNKSLIFSKKTECGYVDKAVRVMKRYYKMLNIDAVISLPKHPLTPTEFKKIVSTLFHRQSSSKSRQRHLERKLKRGQQVGGQIRDIGRESFLYKMVWFSTIGVATLLLRSTLLSLEPPESISSSINAMAVAVLITISTVWIGEDEHIEDDDDDDDDDEDDEVDNEAREARLRIRRVYMDDDVAINECLDDSFRIITSNVDMPPVPENLDTCGICHQLLIQPDADDRTKNTGGYIVHMHPNDEGALHLFHFSCVKLFFSSQLRQGYPTQCPTDNKNINGNELIATHIDEETNFF
jgi:hypothetical protein